MSNQGCPGISLVLSLATSRLNPLGPDDADAAADGAQSRRIARKAPDEHSPLPEPSLPTADGDGHHDDCGDDRAAITTITPTPTPTTPTPTALHHHQHDQRHLLLPSPVASFLSSCSQIALSMIVLRVWGAFWLLAQHPRRVGWSPDIVRVHAPWQH